MKTVKKLFDLLTSSERKRTGVLLIMVLIMAFFDMLGVASILPFIAVLASPDIIETNKSLNSAFTLSNYIGIKTKEQFLFALGLLVFLLLVFSLAFKALTIYAQTRFALMREYSIGKRLMEGYLHQPYSWFLNRNSADLGKNILSEVQTVIANGISPFLTIIAQGAVAIALMFFLFVFNPLLALGAGITLGLAYASVFFFINAWLKRLGQVRVDANQKRYSAVSEAFGAAKEVKLGGLENFYIERFANPAEKYAKGQASAMAIAELPRFALEAIAFGGMLLIILYLMAKSGDFGSILPIITVYAFAGYRLLPALQQIYGAFTQLRFVSPALDALHQELKSLEAAEVQQKDTKLLMPLAQAITLEKVSYRYPNTLRNAVAGIDLTIAAQSTTAFVGTTGSGKTTIVDLILGLLKPQTGKISVDFNSITGSNLYHWQRSIGYVPQHIYLSDDSVAANIAFNSQHEDIDFLAVERAAKIANLHDFVVHELSKGYDTKVGERGVRLSGGQRQRIGIARALYKNPQVLIMDEATSALDNLTEHAVMEAVDNLLGKITIIMIAHRLSTVRNCDQIFLMDQGQLKAKGTFDQLFRSNESFRAMVGNLL